jgi:hypothetical protein
MAIMTSFGVKDQDDPATVVKDGVSVLNNKIAEEISQKDKIMC